MKLLIMTVIAFLSATSSAQDITLPTVSLKLKGNVRTVDNDRVYVRFAGRSTGEKKERLSSKTYDARTRLVESIDFFDDGYTKTVYNYSSEKTTGRIEYFDTAGRPTGFLKPKVMATEDSKLCRDYVASWESNTDGMRKKLSEICKDGSTRATTLEEFDYRGELIRSIQHDAMENRKEFTYDYDPEGNLKEYRVRLESAQGRPWTRIILLADYRFDKQGNWTRVTATVSDPQKPDELLYQYDEVRRISYYNGN